MPKTSSWSWLVAVILLGAFTILLDTFRTASRDWSMMKTMAEDQLRALSGRMDAAGADKKHDDTASADLEIEDVSEPLIWPHPAAIIGGSSTLVLSEGVHFGFDGPHSVAPFMEKAFRRYRKIIFSHRRSRRGVPGKDSESDAVDSRQGDRHVMQLMVLVSSANEELQLETDESYSLAIPDNGTEAKLEATTVYGALRGLETLSQLCSYDFIRRAVVIRGAPWEVRDKPRFPHRGLLIDTSRHFLPVRVIKRVIRSMSYAKLNVLHWHMVDDQSFPIEIPSHPRMWDGAYSPQERYSADDMRKIVEFARTHAVRVMAEVDVPGHTTSWGVGYPELWPSPECRAPLDISNDFTWTVIAGILDDLARVFPYRLFHLGGDEVDTFCWTNTPHISKWLKAKGWSVHDAYAEFVIRVQQMALERGWDPVNWEEPFNEFGERLSNRSIVQNWLGPGTAPRVVRRGLRVLVSNQDRWYLDHLDTSYESFYSNEPTEGISDETLHALVLGGEVCMWGETVDASDIDQTIWPRAAAAAEVLWSPRDVTRMGPKAALERYQLFRCLLNSRGIGAAPVLNAHARTPPHRPGSCYLE